MITQEQIRDLFFYDADSGELIWRKRRGSRAAVGAAAGSINTIGYRVVGIGGKDYLVHRLIWLHVYGYLPKMIDHADGNRANNCIGNLRVATKSTNGANRGKQANNTSGFKGVTKCWRKWRAQIHRGGVNCYLGLFATREEAAEAYARAAAIEFGEFARHE